MSGKDSIRHRVHRPPFAMRLTEEGKNLLKSGPITLDSVSLSGRSGGREETHIVRTIKGIVIDVDALSVTISEPNPIEMGIHTIALHTNGGVEFARCQQQRIFLESIPGTPLLLTLNMHFDGQDIRGVAFTNNLTDTAGTRVLEHEDLGITPRHPRHPKVQRRRHHRRTLQPKRALSDRPADQSTPWKIGDLRWSSHDLGESWLPADGSAQERAQFPDLAVLSSTWSPPDSSSPLSKGWTKNADTATLFSGGKITSIATNHQTYVAVGCQNIDGTPKTLIAHSLDGRDWSESTSRHLLDGGKFLVSAIWVPELGESGLFVVGGIEAMTNGIHTSPDGLTWTRHALNAPEDLPPEIIGSTLPGEAYPFAHTTGLAAGQVFAQNGTAYTRVVILDHEGRTLVSDDGCSTWKYPSTSVAKGFTDRDNRLVWGQTDHTQGLFVAGGENSHIATSPDGIIWTPCTSATAALGAGQKISAMAWMRRDETTGTFIIASEDGTIIVSDDAESWETVSTAFQRIMSSTCVPLGQNRKSFIISGYGGRTHDFMVSLDGRAWEGIKVPGRVFNKYINSITYGQNRLLMGGENGFLALRTIPGQNQFCLPNIDSITGIKAHIKAL